jgi:D-tyrosyl-tRNA(Tyr) deacylase
MKAVVQRVSSASVVVHGETVGQIGKGLLALVSVVREDEDRVIDWMARKLTGLRIFPDEAGKMNRDVKEIGGSLLLVSNFTVAADASEGRRPSFARAAAGEFAESMFNRLVEAVRAQGVVAETGVFGADMKVTLCNDGPVTLVVDSR